MPNCLIIIGEKAEYFLFLQRNCWKSYNISNKPIYLINYYCVML